MKKLSFLIAIVFAASFAMAQNVASVSTTGDANKAYATQTGLNNNANIEQIANSSTATIIQDGTGNKADLDQKGGWPANSTVVGETGYQEQLGLNNQATLWQLSDKLQGGNKGNQYQEGNGNNLLAWQYTIASEVDQDQIGKTNVARSYQTGLNGYVKQYQKGDNNFAAVDEQGGGGSVVGNSATQIQKGNRNKSGLAQYGIGGGGDKTAQGNVASITQTGDDNWAGEGYYNQGMFGVYQNGNYNTATVVQNYNANKSELSQTGDHNTVTVTQNGGLGSFADFVNKSDVTQIGNGNTATVAQTYQLP